jgi:hypothetical protein
MNKVDRIRVKGDLHHVNYHFQPTEKAERRPYFHPIFLGVARSSRFCDLRSQWELLRREASTNQ